MCLTLPGRVVRIDGEDPVARTALIDYGSVQRTANLMLLPEVRVGEFVLVQAGYAIATVPEEVARATLRLAELPLGEATS